MCVYTHTQTHTQVDYYSAIKKNETLPFEATCIQNRNRLTDAEKTNLRKERGIN